MEDETELNAQKYPAVLFAYEIVIKSYDWILSRSDAVDSKIDRIIAWNSSINIGVLAILATKIQGSSFCSKWFFIAAAAFIVITVLGIVTKVFGTLNFPSPEVIYKQELHKTEWEFKKDAIYNSGQDFKKNQKLVNKKGCSAIAMSIIFLINILAIGLWIVSLS